MKFIYILNNKYIIINIIYISIIKIRLEKLGI